MQREFICWAWSAQTWHLTVSEWKPGSPVFLKNVLDAFLCLLLHLHQNQSWHITANAGKCSKWRVRTIFFLRKYHPWGSDFCMVLLLPVFAIEPTKTKKDVWLALWNSVGHSHLDPSMKSQPCWQNSKRLQQEQQPSDPVWLTSRNSMFLVVTICTAKTNGHILNYLEISMLPNQIDFFLDLVWNHAMAAFLYPGSLCLHVVQNSNRRLSPSLLQSFINYMLTEIEQVAKQGHELHGKIK